jgi:choline-glycine betaine transporter
MTNGMLKIASATFALSFLALGWLAALETTADGLGAKPLIALMFAVMAALTAAMSKEWDISVQFAKLQHDHMELIEGLYRTNGDLNARFDGVAENAEAARVAALSAVEMAEQARAAAGLGQMSRR